MNVTANERRLLKDPDWVTEDEADAIMLKRDEKKHGRGYRGAIPLEQLLKKHGIELEPYRHEEGEQAVRNSRRR